jgi:hypothetical protein
VLLIVMYQAQTWRVRPGGEPFTFGREAACCVVLPETDRGVSRTAGSFCYHDRSWWLHNDSSSSVLCLAGDRGFRVDLPPGLQVPLQQWHAKVTVTGALDRYTLRLRAENPVRGSDQQSCSTSCLTVTITGHVPTVRLPCHHAGHHVAAAVPA